METKLQATYRRYDDHNSVNRELWEEAQRRGAPYYKLFKIAMETKTHKERVEEVRGNFETPVKFKMILAYLYAWITGRLDFIQKEFLTYGNTRYEEGVKVERERVREWAKEKKRVKVYNLVKHSTPTNMDTITIPADYESAFKLGEDITLEDLCTFLSDNK